MRLLFDIETNGLLDTVSTIHCIVTKDIDTGEVSRFNSPTGTIEAGLEHLAQAEWISGHNIIDYDLPVLDKLRSWKPRDIKIFDTLTVSRLIWTNLKDLDWSRTGFPTPLIGRHSLKAWGYRLGVRKGTFGETTNWAHWSQEMEDYCAQDLEVNFALLQKILSLNYSQQAMDLEIEFATIISAMSRHGFRFDSEAAGRLHAILVAKREELIPKLREIFPPTHVEMKTPAYWISSLGQFPTKGAAQKAKAKNIVRGPNKVMTIDFNPGSRDEIARRLKERGWVPTEFTVTGKPEVSDEILEAIGTPEAKMLAEYMMVEKRIGQLANGKEALMKHDRHGRIHGQVNTNGAVTGRCTHYNPNVAQIPTVMSPYGKDFRALFCSNFGHVLVGSDASGLELRMLGHYLARFDGGEYANIVVNGDVHSKNRELFGYPAGDTPIEKKTERDYAKRTIYAMIYGGGPWKIGSIRPITQEQIEEYRKDKSGWSRIKKRMEKDDLSADDRIIATTLKGEDIKNRFMDGLPAYKHLVNTVRIVSAPQDASRWTWSQRKRITEAAESLEQHGFPVPKPIGFLRGVDGRRLHIRSDHSALNTLLQHAGAIAVKQATVFFHRHCQERGWTWGKDYALVVHVHDEWQTSCRPEIAEEIGKLAVQSIKESGEHFKFRVALTGEYAIGPEWASTH